VAAKSGVAGNLEPGQTYAGIPAVPGLEWHRRTAILARLAKRHRSNEA
jgi:UDP-3-O-[3-hydroxymyristoyl] glucosamine N-acyltransferase